MRLLADECCDSAIVASLRAAGHDVLSVRLFIRAPPDESLPIWRSARRGSG